MANSLKSEAEEDEKKKEYQYSSSAPNKSNFGLCTLRKKVVEVWKAIMFLAGFLYGAWEEGFHPILSTIKTVSSNSRHSA